MPTFDTPHPISADVQLVAGDVRMTTSDRNDTVVDVHPRNRSKPADVRAAEQTRVECTPDGRLRITASRSWRSLSPFGATGVADVTIDAPTGSSIEGTSGMGTLTAEGELGTCRWRSGMGNIRVDHATDVRLTTAFGDIIVDDVASDAETNTSSGAIRIQRVGGDAVVKNANGATTLGSVEGDLRVKAANGDIIVERAGGAVDAKSAAGSIGIGEVVDGPVSVHTAVGEIAIAVASGSAVWLDLHTSFGNVRNTLETLDAPGPNDRTVEVRARTSAGDIVISHSTGVRSS